MENQTIDAKLLFAKNVLLNAVSVEAIAQIMSAYGFTEEVLTEAQSLYDQAEDLQQQQKLEYGEQYAATTALNLAKANANRKYMKYVKLSRVIFKNDRGKFEALQLVGDRKQSLSGWIQQAKTFYTNALADESILDPLENLSVQSQDFEAALTELSDIEALLAAQHKEKGEAQAISVARDQAFDQLQEWISDYIAIARVALEQDPQLLEVLGIVEPS